MKIKEKQRTEKRKFGCFRVDVSFNNKLSCFMCQKRTFAFVEIAQKNILVIFSLDKLWCSIYNMCIDIVKHFICIRLYL